MNWSDILERYALEHPKKEAAIFEGTRLTYEELSLRVNALANGLAGLGLTKGDRLALIARDCLEFVELGFAVNKLGAIWIPLNWRLSSEELIYMINNAGVKIVVSDAEFSDTVDLMKVRLPSTSSYVVLGGKDKDGWHLYDSLVSKHYGTVSTTAQVELDDVQKIIYTSGTTARPKGVMLTYGNLFWKCVNHIITLGLNSNDICLCALPLFHVAGYDLPASSILYMGGTIILVPKFDVANILGIIQREKVTHTCLTPTVTRMVLEDPSFGKFDLSSMKVLIDGGEKMPLPLAEVVVKKLPCLFANSYGMTETVTGVTFVPEKDILRKISSVGKPIFQAQIKIGDDNDNAVPPGTWGEILVRSPQVFKGYWNNPEATAEALKGGYFHTGDIGYLDDEGYLYIVDRKKDMIKSGGENIAAQEVEAIIREISSVKDVAVVGLPDPKWGETPKAFIILKDGESLNAEQVIAYCLTKLAKFKVPKQVEFVPDFPRTPLGKVLKRELRERAQKI